MVRYFTKDVKPPIPASKQNTGAFAAGDLLFDWKSFTIPSSGGPSKLVSVAVKMRGTNGAVQTARKLDLYFAKKRNGSAPSSLGTVNATLGGKVDITNNLIGQVRINAHDFGGSNFDFINMAQTGTGVESGQGGGAGMPNLVLQGEDTSGEYTGYTTYYLGASAGGGFDFGTNVLTTGAHDVSAIANATIASLDDGSGSSALCTSKFAVGDIIHATDDIIVGEIETINSDTSLTFRQAGGVTLDPAGEYTVPATVAAWQIQNGAAAAGDLANNDELFNIHPIKIILSFES